MEHNAIFSFLFIPLPGITKILHDTLNVKIHYIIILQYVSIWPLLWRLDNIKINIQHTIIDPFQKAQMNMNYSI